jgi:hypothetical protein
MYKRIQATGHLLGKNSLPTKETASSVLVTKAAKYTVSQYGCIGFRHIEVTASAMTHK